MTNWILPLASAWAVCVSSLMAFRPMDVLAYVRRSKFWMWYLKFAFNFTQETLAKAGTVWIVRIQGVVGLPFGLLGLHSCISVLLAGSD